MPSRRQASTLIAGLACWSMLRPAMAQRPAKLVFVFSRAAADPYTQWLIRIYTEALARISIEFEFLEVPPSRATAMSSAGLVDGELGRTHEFAELYTSLVRVESSNNAVLFSAYATKDVPKLDGWAALRRAPLSVAFRAGIKEVEDEMRHDAYRDRTTTVKTLISGLKMLQRDRVDVYVDVQNAVDVFLAAPHAELDPPPAPQPRLVGVLHRTTGHAYLHERHRSLAPELAAILQEMKAEGRHERYLTETLIANAMERGVPRARAEAETEIVVKALLSEQ
jgi:polar amino acid transport system substrate-binding protein